ncbi:MAG: A/G-specific adenine glycosylase [Jiangellales bacterium]
MHETTLAWFDEHARDLPWRSPQTTPWGVLVSEVMLQQTPVARVAPVYLAWMTRWPTPDDLADDPVAEAIRAWGRLGYPRRAVRLHAAATQIATRHAGEVPSALDDLRALPGVGEYTAAAVAAFAFNARVAVLDTNVRRVLARLRGQAQPTAHLTNVERTLAADLLPADPPVAARWSVAVMEVGALVCTSSSPRCHDCPLAAECSWLAAGRPATDLPRRRQPFEGTDRQVRGRLMAVLREADAPVDPRTLDAVGLDAAPPVDDAQRQRALASLVTDGLVVVDPDGRYRLPD